MKNSLLIIAIIAFFYHATSAQRVNKFYNKQDSVDYNHYNMIMSKGYKIMIKDGKIKRELVDSSYQDSDNFIRYDSAYALQKQIPKFEYYLRHQNENYTRLAQLKTTDQHDTITHLSFEGRDLKKTTSFQVIKM